MNSAARKMMERRALRAALVDIVGGILILASWALWGWLMMTVAQP